MPWEQPRAEWAPVAAVATKALSSGPWRMELTVRKGRMPRQRGASGSTWSPWEVDEHWKRRFGRAEYCHDTASELIENVASFVARINRDVCEITDRLWVKDELDPEEEKLRFSK